VGRGGSRARPLCARGPRSLPAPATTPAPPRASQVRTPSAQGGCSCGWTQAPPQPTPSAAPAPHLRRPHQHTLARTWARAARLRPLPWLRWTQPPQPAGPPSRPAPWTAPPPAAPGPSAAWPCAAVGGEGVGGVRRRAVEVGPKGTRPAPTFARGDLLLGSSAHGSSAHRAPQGRLRSVAGLLACKQQRTRLAFAPPQRSQCAHTARLHTALALPRAETPRSGHTRAVWPGACAHA